MSSTVPHLSVRSLVGVEGIEKIMDDLADDVYHFTFGKADLGMEKCTDDRLKASIQPLFTAIGFAAEVWP